MDSTLATISVTGMLDGISAKFKPFFSNDTSVSLRGREDLRCLVNIRNSGSLFRSGKFQKLALLSIFSGVKYSLGINSDLFKYFNGLICRKSGCYASRNKLSLFFRVFFSTLSKSYSFSKEAFGG